MNALPACARVRTCETDPAASGCQSACYSAEEANCLSQLEVNTVKKSQQLSGTDADSFNQASKPLLAAFTGVEYQRGSVIQNLLIQSSVESILKYLDLLESATQKSSSDVGAEAKSLSDRLQNGASKLSDITGKKLSDADKKTEQQVTSALTAFGKFVADAQVIAQNAADGQAIKELVAQKSGDAEALIQAVKTVAIADSTLAGSYGILSTIELRQSFQERYGKTADAYERSILLAQRDTLQFQDVDKASKAIAALFDAMSGANQTLTRLVMNPNDKDLQAKSNAQFQEFKLIVGDIVAIANTVR
jgi:hypothetical protein